jgi:hypothetical protein
MSKMQSLEEAFETACSNGKIPGAVLLATDKTGTHLKLILLHHQTIFIHLPIFLRRQSKLDFHDLIPLLTNRKLQLL